MEAVALGSVGMKTRPRTWFWNKERANKTFSSSFLSVKLHILVSSTSVKLNVDCQEVDEKKIKAAGNTSSDGYQVLGKMSKSIGSKGESATVSPGQDKGKP